MAPSDLGFLYGLTYTVPHLELAAALQGTPGPVAGSAKLLEVALRSKPRDNVSAIVFSDAEAFE